MTDPTDPDTSSHSSNGAKSRVDNDTASPISSEPETDDASLEDIRPVRPDPGDMVAHLDNGIENAVIFELQNLVVVPEEQRDDYNYPVVVLAEARAVTAVLNRDLGLVRAMDQEQRHLSVTLVNDLFSFGEDAETTSAPVNELSTLQTEPTNVPMTGVDAESEEETQSYYQYEILL